MTQTQYERALLAKIARGSHQARLDLAWFHYEQAASEIAKDRLLVAYQDLARGDL